MRYHWQLDRGVEIDDCYIEEGWAEVFLLWDADLEFQGIEIDAIEIEPTGDRHLKIQRGYVPVRHTVPAGAAWERLQQQIEEHLESDEILQEILDVAEAFGEIPRPSALERHIASYSRPYP